MSFILGTSRATCLLKIQIWSWEPRDSYHYLKSTRPCQVFVHNDSEFKNGGVHNNVHESKYGNFLCVHKNVHVDP